MGVPTATVDLVHRNDFLRALHLIYNEWYRDENLQDRVVLDLDDGPDDPADYSDLLPRGKRKDYFTSGLLNPQKGADVTIPLGTTAPVVSDTTAVNMTTATVTDVDAKIAAGAVVGLLGSSTGETIAFGDNSGLETDLSAASSQTINQLREAWQIQVLLEIDARGGTRYIEMNYAHFGVLSPDQRLQRPEYLGGGTTNININPVAQQSATGTGTPQGNLAAMAT